MFAKNHPIILFVDRSGFSVFQDTLPNIPKFNFTPDVVANLDVISKEQLVNLISTFIQINKIVPSSLGLVLSDTVIYEKDLVNPPGTSLHPASQTAVPSQPPSNPMVTQENADKEHKEEIQNFLENIPFEEVLAKDVKTDKIDRIVAVNKDLIMTIADVFEKSGSVIEAIIPSFMYGQNVNFTAGLTSDNIQAILGGSEIARIGNLLTDQQKMSSPQSLEGEQKEKEKKPQNLRQFILIGIFVTLLVILVVVYLNMGVSPAPTPDKRIQSSTVNTGDVPTIPPVAGSALDQTPIATLSANINNIKIKIVQSSQSSAVSDSLKDQLLEIGFENVVSEITADTISEKSSVVFSQNISDDIRSIVIAEIKKVLPDVSVLENQNLDLAITILLGKS